MRSIPIGRMAGTILLTAVCGIGPATRPTSRPAAATKPVDDVAAVRARLLRWTRETADGSLEAFRAGFHTTDDREAKYADWLATEIWAEAKTQKAVRDKWGAAVEARFAHGFGVDTVEDDRAAKIAVDGDAATATYPSKAVPPDPLVRVDGQWQLDVHRSLSAELKIDPHADQHRRSAAKLMAQLRDEIANNRFPDAGEFMVSYQTRLLTR